MMKATENIKTIPLRSNYQQVKAILLDMLNKTDSEVKKELILTKLRALENNKSAC